jgi:3-oxoacyl-[acyl-carrier-protein] synthase-3
MAVLAARQALAEAGCDAMGLALVMHAWTHYQGHDFWSPAHFVAHQIGASRAVAMGLQQMCNGGAAALELAAAWLRANPPARHCLVTTADAFGGPAFDRLRGDQGIAYGDGATAMVLGGPIAPYALCSTATACAPELELMHRGDDAFGSAPRGEVNVRRTKSAYAKAGMMPHFRATAQTAIRAVIRQSLAHAGFDPADDRIRGLALPRLGRSVLDAAYLPAVDGLTAGKTLSWGAETGHLGAGDAAANLRQIQDEELLGPGEVAVLLSAGAGFSWTSLVVQRSVEVR